MQDPNARSKQMFSHDSTTIVSQVGPRIRLPFRRSEPEPMKVDFMQVPLSPTVKQEVTAADVMSYIARRRTVILLGLTTILTCLFAVLAWWVHRRPAWFLDVVVTRQLQGRKADWIREIMLAVSGFGNMAYLAEATLVLAAVLFWMFRLRIEALVLLLVYEIEQPVGPFLKSLLNRPRPSAPKVHVIEVATGTSFPSGHVMSYTVFWGFIFLMALFGIKGKPWAKAILMLISAAFIVLIGPSRIYLGDHWATDVIGAYLAGSVLLCLGLLVYFTLKEFSTRLKAMGLRAVQRFVALVSGGRVASI